MFCLIPEAAIKLKQAVVNGKLNPEKLNEMTSPERRAALAEIVGKESAQQVNLEFEKKLLLKNQDAAMYRWIKDVTGMSSAEKASLSEKIRQNRAERQRRIFDPKDNEIFLGEIASEVYARKFKTEVSLREAQDITELAADVQKAKGTAQYGPAKVALDNYANSIKERIEKPGLLNPLTQEGIRAKTGAVYNNAKVSFNFIADNTRSFVASMDNSFWFRQGLKALMNPRFTKIWLDNFITSFKDIAVTLKGGTKAGDAVLDAVKAEIYNRENFQNGRYELGHKLDIGVGLREEAFPTSFPQRIPVLGRLFKASEVAYEAGAMRLRADIADKMYSMAERAGVDMNNPHEIGSINDVVNGMTGRGKTKYLGESGQKFVNRAFFSFKFFKSNVDFLTLHQGKLSTFATKQAAMNLLSTVAVTGVILQIAKALDPEGNKDAFTLNSSRFGKIHLGGNAYVDITGGAGGIVVLASKLISNTSKSPTTGIVTKLGEGYGTQTRTDVLVNFTENKFSPLFAVFKDIFNQKDFAGNKPTVQGETGKLVTPILVSNISQFKGESGATQLLGLIMDGLGLSAGVSQTKLQDWTSNPGAELTQFRTKVGEEKFKEANDKFNKQYQDWFKNVVSTDKYKNLTDDEKQKVLTQKKSDLREQIFKQYGFRYKKQKSAPLPKF